MVNATAGTEQQATGREQAEIVIEAKDFGPMTSARIRLRPLTVFIGPNNSGKSYAAMLVRALFGAHSSGRAPSGPLESVRCSKAFA